MQRIDIGAKAGVIWHLLYSKGPMSIRKIGEYTHYKEGVINLSLGWLSREGKIQFFEKEGSIYVELSNSIAEIYYT